ncbi:MAG: hypothetical protein ACD_84C00038G0007 [uncultured bacterium]|nr:MAG: hypothetical protein ACD_84C00038G0007 [uncultured bacterium]
MSSKNEKREGIYVELDVLLDTRMGTLKRINSDLADKIALSETYHSREHDVFDGIDPTQFKEVYQNRDVLTLSMSLLTNAIPLIRHLISQLGEQAIARPFHDGGEVFLNYYPYQLSREDVDEIQKAMTIWMQGIAPVTLINIPPNNLTPSYCKENYSLMLMYEYASWIDMHAEEFAKVQIPDVTLFVPAIYFEKKPTEEELKGMVKESMHPMQAIEFLASTIIGLKLIDVMHFSILSKDQKTA